MSLASTETKRRYFFGRYKRVDGAVMETTMQNVVMSALSLLWLTFPGQDEKNVQLHRLKSHSFVLSKLLLYTIIAYVVTLYWANIFYHIKDDTWVFFTFFATTIYMIVLNGMSLFLSANMKPEALVADPYIDSLMTLSVLSILACFYSALGFHQYYDLCHPMSMFTENCDGFQFLTDFTVTQMFLAMLLQLAYPNLSWTNISFVYIIGIAFSIYAVVNDSVLEVIPLLTVSAIFSAGALLTVRSEMLNSYYLSIEEEEHYRMAQEAQLGQRLRLMISGVAHDLKSPLSALALGLENVGQIYAQDTTSSKNDELREVMRWMATAKNSMSTIISRCVDVNQAMSGLPLTPNLTSLNVLQETEQLVASMQELNPHTRIQLHVTPPSSGATSEVLPKEDAYTMYSDQVWLNESIGCLLNNAIKFCDYTTKPQQSIDITLSLLHVPSSADTVATSLPRINSLRSRLLPLSEQPRSSDGSHSTAHHHEDSFIRIEVRDEGMGVAPDALPSLFNFSGYVPTQVHVGGAGLGLFTLARRVQALGGTYGYAPANNMSGESTHSLYSSEMRTGSVFWFQIPQFSAPQTAPSMFSLQTCPISPAETERFKEKDAKNRPVIAPKPENTITVDNSSDEDHFLSDESNMFHGSNHTAAMDCASHPQPGISHDAVVHDLSSPKVNIINGNRINNTFDISSVPISTTHSEVVPQRSSSNSCSKEQVPTSIGASQPMHILVVDDSLPIRKMCSMVLAKRGHRVQVATNGKEALHTLTSMLSSMSRTSSEDDADIAASGSNDSIVPFDLVLMDIQMPVMDGIEAVTRFREIEHEAQRHGTCRFPRQCTQRMLPILAMSASSDQEIIQRALSAGMSHFLAKPFGLQQFDDVVQQLLVDQA